LGKGERAAKKNLKKPSLAFVTYMGFNHDGSFDPTAITETDKEKEAEARSLLHEWWMGRMNPKMGWSPILKPDKAPLDFGMEGYNKYDNTSRSGQAVARCVVQATPERVMAYWCDTRSQINHKGVDVIESAFTVRSGVILFPANVPTISDRESCYREFVAPTKDEDDSYTNVSYTVSDERRPEVNGRVRIDAISCAIIKELPGSDGKASECFRMVKFNPHVSRRY
jgi:hypothetical protein